MHMHALQLPDKHARSLDTHSTQLHSHVCCMENAAEAWQRHESHNT